ncbi:hypothetical protein, partial [uncultured Megasphaera sp.]|uniref:hypothetical protein n=1 Tax=uncultured Megasphaera sp. TaxID=165188 RepID=UPI002599B91E
MELILFTSVNAILCNNVTIFQSHIANQAIASMNASSFYITRKTTVYTFYIACGVYIKCTICRIDFIRYELAVFHANTTDNTAISNDRI